MASSEKEGGKGFTVTDRRAFADEAAAAPEPTKETPPESPPQGRAAEPASHELPPVDFHTFILSLGSSVLLHLGELEDPGTGKAHRDLAMARHTIEVLAMLEEKTRGNLNDAEKKLVEGLLFDLRMRFVEASKRA